MLVSDCHSLIGEVATKAKQRETDEGLRGTERTLLYTSGQQSRRRGALSMWPSSYLASSTAPAATDTAEMQRAERTSDQNKGQMERSELSVYVRTRAARLSPPRPLTTDVLPRSPMRQRRVSRTTKAVGALESSSEGRRERAGGAGTGLAMRELRPSDSRGRHHHRR